ncbi:hypothetical protein AVEN_171427-1 [Araneus ventricosus]|uniref:Retroviral polymerase SH3-like domain-containing protein n=1 Tax=Araneus ventricosus TaxID=182803 RepID=A0A4Y2D2E9_ARAVE|nr:hypothetical protein AVEN_171427-1 [Araneus ventricosus]
MFGTECFIHIPKQKTRKFDKKAIKGYFGGYCGERDGNRIRVPDKNDVVLSRDVHFKDEIMPEKTSIEIVQTQSTEELCEEDASCIDAGEETETQDIDYLNITLETKVYNL